MSFEKTEDNTMNWKEIDRTPFIGALNEHHFVMDERSGLYLQRIPKENLIIMDSINHEYGFMGFFDAGGEVSRRTPSEQFQFAQTSAFAGLRVLPPVEAVRDTTIYRFLTDAQTLDEYLPQISLEEAENIVYQIFDDLRKAHTKERKIYGDRWSHNMLIVPRYGFINVDFDLKISGPPATEFEVAQATYYTLSAGRESVIPILSNTLIAKDWFRIKLMETFLRRHAIWFDKTKYGGIQKETEVLIDFIHRRNQTT